MFLLKRDLKFSVRGLPGISVVEGKGLLLCDLGFEGCRG